MPARSEPHRRRLRPGALARIGDARDGHRAVEPRLQRRRALDPDQVLAAALQGDVADRVEDVAVGRLVVEARVAVGKVEGAIELAGRGRHRPVEGELLPQIEQPQRRERPAHPPVLHGAHPPPRLDLALRIARRLRPPSRDARGRLAHQARSARGRRRWQIRRGFEDGVVDGRRFSLQIEQPYRRQLRRRIARGRLQSGDEVAHRLERVGAVLGDLAQPVQRQGALRVGSGLRRLGQLRFRAARVGEDQVTQPAGPREQGRVLARRCLRLIEAGF